MTTPIIRDAPRIVPSTGIKVLKLVTSAVKLLIAFAGAPVKLPDVAMLLRTSRPTAAVSATTTTVRITAGAPFSVI